MELPLVIVPASLHRMPAEDLVVLLRHDHVACGGDLLGEEGRQHDEAEHEV